MRCSYRVLSEHSEHEPNHECYILNEEAPFCTFNIIGSVAFSIQIILVDIKYLLRPIMYVIRCLHLLSCVHLGTEPIEDLREVIVHHLDDVPQRGDTSTFSHYQPIQQVIGGIISALIVPSVPQGLLQTIHGTYLLMGFENPIYPFLLRRQQILHIPQQHEPLSFQYCASFNLPSSLRTFHSCLLALSTAKLMCCIT